MFALKPRIEIAARVLLSVVILFNALAPTGALAKASDESTVTKHSTRQSHIPINLASLSNVFASILKFAEVPPSNQERDSFIVNSTEDTPDSDVADGVCDDGTGSCTLRAAIEQSNALPGRNAVTFNLPGEGPYTIQPLQALPVIDDPLVIDGTTQPGYAGAPLIVLAGSLAGDQADGLQIAAGGSTVRGLVINQFGYSGIHLEGKGANQIEDNYIGTDITGMLALGNRIGILIDGTAGNIIGGKEETRNLISGNGTGIYIYGKDAKGNQVRGNMIGTDINGDATLGNDIGVRLEGSSGSVLSRHGKPDNYIEGNANNIYVHGNNILENQIQSDAMSRRPGISPTITIEEKATRGSRNSTRNSPPLSHSTATPPFRQVQVSDFAVVPVSFHFTGFRPYPLTLGATFVVNSTGDGADKRTSDGVCSTSQGVCTLRAAIQQANASAGQDTINFNISGSGPYVIQPASALPAITEAVTINGTSQPGYAGTPLIQLNGSSAGQGADGLRISSGSSTIRGLVIYNFNSSGITLITNGNNLIEGNYIGTDVTGTLDRGNHWVGIYLNSSSNNTIGGTTTAARNLVSGNDAYGVEIHSSTFASTGNLVQGNYIGVNAAGTAALGNAYDGVYLYSASGNTIGGTATGARNLISGNNGSGISIYGAGATGNVVQGNYIGTNATGNAVIPNTYEGVLLDSVSGAGSNTIGGSVIAARNLISGNRHGIRLDNNNTSSTIIQGNYIGTDATGNLDLGNIYDGISIDSAANVIGGLSAGAGNLLSGNDRYGVYLYGSYASGNIVQGNFVGTNTSGIVDLGNSMSGVAIGFGSFDNTIGGTTTSARNLISGNDEMGLLISEPGTDGNLIQGNYIGTDVTGTLPLGNTLDGVHLQLNSTGTVVGGTASGAGNLIAANGWNGGIRITTSANGNTVQGNTIGTDPSRTLDLGNSPDGISINGPNNQIGGTETGAANHVAHNTDNGIYVQSGPGNRLAGNLVWSNGALGIDLDPLGFTPNDPGDLDTGPNNLQNSPIVTSFTTGTNTAVHGTLNSSASTAFRLEFFADSMTCAPSTYPQGRRFLGFTNLSTDANGDATFDITLTATTTSEEAVTVTATDPLGNTSEFSACPVAEPATPTPTATDTPTNTPTYTPTETQTPTSTFTATSTDTPTNTPTDTPTLTPTYTSTSTLTPTRTPTATRTPTPTKAPPPGLSCVDWRDGLQHGWLQSPWMDTQTQIQFDEHGMYGSATNPGTYQVGAYFQMPAGGPHKVVLRGQRLTNITVAQGGDAPGISGPLSDRLMVGSDGSYSVTDSYLEIHWTIDSPTNLSITPIFESFCLAPFIPTPTRTPSPTATATTRPMSSRTYTLNADFSEGTSTNLSLDPADQLQLDNHLQLNGFIWVAVSGKGTVVKIDTETGQVLGEYWIAPSDVSKDPSRTTVDMNGNVWTANRAGSSVVHIGLAENGQCVDRNNNDVIDTSTGLNDIRPWSNADGADSNGGVSTAEDECILHYTIVHSSGTRHVSVDENNDVWVSGLGGRNFDLLDGETGQIKRTEWSVDYGGYGGLIDSNGVIWSSNRLLRWDTSKSLTGSNGGNWTGYEHDSYGLCIDSQGNVWNTQVNGGLIRKFAPDGTVLGVFSHGAPNAQGCVVDGNDDVWVAHTLLDRNNTVGHLKNDGTFVGNVTVGLGPTGVAVDAAGKIWATNYSDHTVSRIDPNAGPIGLDGKTHVGQVDFETVDLGGILYNYSDMTGSTLTGAPEEGQWSVVFDSGLTGAEWGTITWFASVPGDGALTVTTSSSEDGVNFTQGESASNGQDLSVENGRYLKVVADFQRASTGESPILYDLTIATDGITPQPTPIYTPTSASTATPTPVPTQDPCLVWDLARDFKAATNQNPNQDSCGNPNIWRYMGSPSTTRDSQSYYLLPNFSSDANGDNWVGSAGGYPVVSFNKVAHDYGGVPWLADTVVVHPGPSHLSVIAWESPLDGTVSITGGVSRYNTCGDGIRWYLDKNTTNLASGIYSRSSAQAFGQGDGGIRLRSVTVNRGDMVYLAIHPNGAYDCDSTRVSLFIQALDGSQSPAPVNLALGQAATQSSTGWDGVPSRVVDGNTDGNYWNGSVSHTLADPQAWWQVDLGAVQSIENIQLWNRTDCCSDEVDNFYVFVSDVPFTSTDLNTTLSQSGVWSIHKSGQGAEPTTIEVNRTGRYVRVQRTDTYYLSIAEVQIWGKYLIVPTDTPVVPTPTGPTPTPTNTPTLTPTATPTLPPLQEMVIPGWIGSPAQQATVSGVVPITLAEGITLQSGTIDYWPVNDMTQVKVLATGLSGNGGDTLASLDTTTLANGSYVVRLQGTDSNSNQQDSGILITVSGEYKPGRVRFTITDLTIPVVGLPITIARTYDSLERNQVGDFGYGWSLDIGNPKLEVNPAYDVTLTMPDGRRSTFYFTPRSYGGVFSVFLYPDYTPEAGVYGKLSSNGCDVLVLSGGQYWCFLEGDYQPTEYTYTDPYGREFLMDADPLTGTGGTLKTITDLNDNVLTFAPDGITSSAGDVQVPFERDAQGRITKITYPAGKDYLYAYDAQGDLESVTFPNVTLPDEMQQAIVLRYGYYPDHFFKEATDPRGYKPVMTTYDSAGRVESVTDAAGNETAYAYDVAAHTTTIHYRGDPEDPDDDLDDAILVYDEAGYLTHYTFPAEHETTYTYNENHKLIKIEDPLDHKTQFTYNEDGHPTSIIDPLDKPLGTVEYNQYGGPTTMTTIQGGEATVQYDPETFMPLSASDNLGSLGGYTWTDRGNPETYTDQHGETTDYTYTAEGYVKTKTDPLEHVTYYVYDLFGRVTDMTVAYTPPGQPTLPERSTTHYEYDELGRQIKVTIAYGDINRAATTKYEYDANGNRTAVVDPLGRRTEYQYDNANRLELVIYAVDTPLQSTTKYEYDVYSRLKNQIVAFDTPDQSITHYEYYDNGLKKDVTVAFTEPYASITHYEYYDDGRVKNVTTAYGKADETTTHYEYDAAGRTTDVTVAYLTTDASTTHYTYYDSGLLESVTTAYGDASLAATTYYFYDTRGRATMTRYPDRTTSHQLYDLTPDLPGWMNMSVDQAGVMTSSIYDEAGRLERSIVSAVDPDTQEILQHTSHYQYDAANRLTDSFNPLNNHTSFTYYPNGQMHTSTSWLDETTPYITTYDYNLAGEQVSVRDANDHLTQYQYNERGLLKKTIYPPTLGDTGEVSTSQTYDLAGRLITSTDENGVVTRSTYNAAGQLTSVTLADDTTDATTIQYGYNFAGQLTSITDDLDHTTSFAYNHAGQQIKKTLPGDGTTFEEFHYNVAGNMDSHRLEDGHTNSFVYDEMNRLTEIAYFDGQYANFTYTDGGQRWTASTRTQAPATPQITEYSYDPFQRLQQVTAPDGERAVSYTYYENDQRHTMTTPAGMTTYGYDALGRLTSVNAGGGESTYQYDPVGFLVEKELPNGVKTDYTPNARDQLTNLASKNASDAVLQSFEYKLDNAGNRKKVIELGGSSITWEYDRLYRLTDEIRRNNSDVITTQAHFAYDAAGNRDWMTVDSITTDYTYNNLDQLSSASSVTYDYDGRGNLWHVRDGSQTTTYTYDAADRLATVQGPSSTVQFAYDADGRRVKQTVGSQVTNYLWDEASAYEDVVLETNGSGETLASYTLGGTDLISQTRSGVTSYYLQDGQGSTRALTGTAGSITDTYSYTAFGELFNQTGSTTNIYLYTGQQFDSLTGLYDLRARYYDPALGRFLSQDTYPVNFNNPIELNRYGYAANSPINLADPTGKAAMLEYSLILGIGAAGGAAATYFCGGSFAINALFGVFAAAILYTLAVALPPLAFGAALFIGITGGLGAIQNMEVFGLNRCNGFQAVSSLLMVAVGASGLAKGGGGSNLRAPSDSSYPNEIPGPNTGNNGYPTGERQPININNGTRISELLSEWLTAGPEEKINIQQQLNEITMQRIGGRLGDLGVDLQSLPQGQEYNCVSCANIFLPLEKQLPGYATLEDPTLLNALRRNFIEIPNRSSLQTGDIISWHGNGEYGIRTYHVGVYVDGFVFQKLSAIGPYVALTFDEIAPLSPSNSYMQFWRIP